MVLEIIVAVLVLLTLYNLIRIRGLKKQIEQAKDSLQSTLSWSKEDLRSDTTNLRTVVKILAAGGRVTGDMVDQGKPFADMSAAEVQQFLSKSPAPDAVVLDVRTPGEYQAGHIPGAKLIPLDEIEQRLDEIPKQVETLFVVCQGGTRSAAACEVLSKFGYTNLVNIHDGTASWPGKVEIGVSIRPPASTRTNAGS